MFNAKNIDWDKIIKPPDGLKLGTPTDDKIKDLAMKLKSIPLYLSDEYRSDEFIGRLIWNYLHGASLFYEIGNWDGLIVFSQIKPEWKAYVTFKGWNTDVFKDRKLIRNARVLLRNIIDEFQLKRVEVNTADKSVVKFAKMFGFELEGTKRKSFCWNGEYLDEYILALVED